MKQWSDKYYFRYEFKGGSGLGRPQVIIATSNYSIKEVYPISQDHEPIERRFQAIHMADRYVPLESDPDTIILKDTEIQKK
jgi:hypothetical protein